ncbi:MAG: hypothetical protein LBV43_15430 [Prevotella sp.]|jgi:LysM repeat protein|nr:hypothetical protein [Prevotella sp.]
MKKTKKMKKAILFKTIALSLMILSMITSIISCSSKPNDKLKIDGKKYTISLGDINYDSEKGLVTIQVLADGNPLSNPSIQKKSSITIAGELVSSSVSVSQPVKMNLEFKGQTLSYDELVSSSEDGIFVFGVKEAPEKISVYTGLTMGEHVFFDAKTKQVISSSEYYPPVQKEIRD